MMRKVMNFLKKWLAKSSVSTMENVSVEASVKVENKHRKSSLSDKLESYLFASYDFRFNVLTEQTEYRRKG